MHILIVCSPAWGYWVVMLKCDIVYRICDIVYRDILQNLIFGAPMQE